MSKSIAVLLREAEAHVAAAERHLSRLRSVKRDLESLELASAKLASVSLGGFLVAKKGGRGAGRHAGGGGIGRRRMPVKRGAPRGRRAGPTIADQIHNVITEGFNLTSGSVITAMQALRPGIKPPSVYTTLNKLKKEGRLRQEGGVWHKKV